MCYVVLCGIKTQSKTRSTPAGQRIENRRRPAPPPLPPVVGFTPMGLFLICLRNGYENVVGFQNSFPYWVLLGAEYECQEGAKKQQCPKHVTKRTEALHKQAL